MEKELPKSVKYFWSYTRNKKSDSLTDFIIIIIIKSNSFCRPTYIIFVSKFDYIT